MLPRARLHRYGTGPQGSPGYLVVPGFFCATLELPWRDNQRNFSCIPEKIYICRLRLSPRFGWCYHVTGVPDRTVILSHSGNFAGDRLQGFRTHTYGCILQAKYHGWLANQKAILVSKHTVRRFIQYMDGQDFELEIINHF